MAQVMRSKVMYLLELNRVSSTSLIGKGGGESSRFGAVNNKRTWVNVHPARVLTLASKAQDFHGYAFQGVLVEGHA